MEKVIRKGGNKKDRGKGKMEGQGWNKNETANNHQHTLAVVLFSAKGHL